MLEQGVFTARDGSCQCALPDAIHSLCRDAEQVEADVESQRAANRRILLEMIGDRPHAEATAPENYIFVCKLNPVTTEEDLETIFARFGELVACDIIRDKKTGDSLNYAFIGFADNGAAEEAYLKMNNALVDDRRASSFCSGWAPRCCLV